MGTDVIKNNNTWLEDRLVDGCQRGVKTFVLAGAPGVGKSYFLKKIAQEHNSIFIEIRHAMETDTLRGFWKAILSSVGIDSNKVGDTPYSWSTAFCEFLKNREPKNDFFIIIDALGRAPELVDNAGIAGLDNLPEGVFVLIGTRPGRHLDVLESSGAKVEWISPNVREHLSLIKEWINSNIKDPSGEITEGIIKYSEGNFFIAKHLIKAINTGEISIHEMGKKIPALEAALSVLWEDQYEQTPFEVRDDLVAIACLIAESGEPLTCSSICDFLGYPASKVGRAVGYLRPLLKENNISSGLSFFSNRLAALIANRYRRDLVKVHENVIAFFRDSYPSWEEMDDKYGWFYLGYHCDRLARTSRCRDFSTLHWLGEGPYIKAKLKKTRSLNAVLDDLSRCLKAALEDGDLPRIVSYGLRIPRLRAKEVMNGLHDLADVGEFKLAYERVMLLQREDSRFKALILLAWQVLSEEQKDYAKVLALSAGNIVNADILEEDRLLFAFMFSDLLAVLKIDELESILDAIKEPLHCVDVTWRIGVINKVDKESRLDVLGLALKYANKIKDKNLRNSWIKRLKSYMSDVKRSKQDWNLSRAIIDEINAIELHCESDEEFKTKLNNILEAEENDRPDEFRSTIEFLGSYKDENKRVEAIASLVSELIKYSNETWLVTIFEDIITTIVALHSQEYRQKAIVFVSRLITGVQRAKGWRDIFVRLGAVIETIEDAQLRVRAWVWLALARYEARDYKGAQDTLNLSASLAFHIEDLDRQAEALSLLSSCAVAIGNSARARNLAYHALQAWEAPSEQRIDAETKAAMIVAVSANINEERSLEYYDSSIKMALEMPDVRARANLLAALASNLYKMGEDDWARRTQDQALEQAKSMEAGYSQAITLTQLAIQESLCGNVSSSDEVLDSAEKSAREETNAEKRREALLSVASAKRNSGDEIGARTIVSEMMKELEHSNINDLMGASNLHMLAGLTFDSKSKELLVRMLHKIHKNIKNIESDEGQKATLVLLRCWLALGDLDKAREAYLDIIDVELKCKAKICLAISALDYYPRESTKILDSIPVFQERMQGIKECADKLLARRKNINRPDTLKVLADLTLMAVEDERCADILISKWISISTDRKAVIEALTKIGYPIQEILMGQLDRTIAD